MPERKVRRDGRNKLFEGGGLYLDLRPSGTKKWRLKFGFDAKENLLTFGDQGWDSRCIQSRGILV
jgi:hypothetical protein